MRFEQLTLFHDAAYQYVIYEELNAFMTTFKFTPL